MITVTLCRDEVLLVWSILHVWLVRTPLWMRRERCEMLREIERKFESAYEGAV